MEALRMRHANFIREKSGLRLESLRTVDIEIARPRHLLTAGSSYTELPKFLSLKRAIVNVKNKDQRCFGYAILSALHQATTNVCQPSHYERFFAQHAELNQLTYPVEIDQFERIEQRTGISFNVFTFYDDQGQARYHCTSAPWILISELTCCFGMGILLGLRALRGFSAIRTRMDTFGISVNVASGDPLPRLLSRTIKNFARR